MKLISSQNLFLLEELVKKNFSSKYKDSVLGILWTILHPLLLMLLFSIIFSTLFNRNIQNYKVYFFTGWCLFMFFTSAISASMNSLRSNKNILSRNPVPKYIFVLGSIIAEFFNFIIMLILLIVIMIITRTPFYLTMSFSFIPLISLFIMIIGLGLIVSVACVYYSDILYLWTVVSMMFMYASAIFYPIEIIPESYRQYMALNPLFCIIDQFRCFVIQGVFPKLIYMVNSILLSLIILVFGIIVFKKYGNKVTMRF